MAGLAAQGPLPAGMLRIRLGSQERYVWPVHLPGWLALGWRVAGAAAERPPLADARSVVESAPEPQSEPAPTRGKRGRRRKEESSSPVATEPITTEPLGAKASDEIAEAVEPAEPDDSAEPSDDLDATAEIPVLTALPDDLFDDQLT